MNTSSVAGSKSPPTGEQTRAAVHNGPGTMSIWQRVWRDVLLLGSGNVGVVIFQLCFRSILIAALVPATYGRLSLVLSIYNTVWILAASGLPNSVARYIAISPPQEDAAIIRSAVRAAILPTSVAAFVIAVVAGFLLNSAVVCLLAAIGLSSLVFSLLTMGILRGRGRVASAASILPITAVAEVIPLAILWFSGIGVTAMTAFGAFCLGNVIGMITGILLTKRTAPEPTPESESSPPENTPGVRQLLGFSLWLATGTAGLALLPLVVRLSAALDSYTQVAIVDVVLVLFAIPQRVGTVIALAVTPHASRAIHNNEATLTISRREHLFAIVPFVLAAVIVAFTPVIGWLFDALGRPEYDKSAVYLALALLAGPARVLYGLTSGVLIGHGEARFLAVTVLSITGVASVLIVVAAALGSAIVAFALFTAALWAVYLVGLARIGQLSSAPKESAPAPA